LLLASTTAADRLPDHGKGDNGHLWDAARKVTAAIRDEGTDAHEVFLFYKPRPATENLTLAS